MASNSADQALSPDVPSLVICGRPWKLINAIHSTGVGVIEKKMRLTFGDAFVSARVKGVFMGGGSGQKYCVKWTNIPEEPIYEYGANHQLFQDPSKELPPKAPKIHGPQPLFHGAA